MQQLERNYERESYGLAIAGDPKPLCGHFDGRKLFHQKCRREVVPGMEWCAEHGLMLTEWAIENAANETRAEYLATPEELDQMYAELVIYRAAVEAER